MYPSRLSSRLSGGLIAVLLGLYAPASYAIEVTPTNDLTTLVKQLFGSSGLQVTGKSYTGAAAAIGTYKKGPQGLADGIILSTGKAKDAEPPNTEAGTTTDFFGPGDELCKQLVPNFTLFDAARLDIKFKHDTSITGAHLEFVVGSEEYPEFLGQKFNDVVGVFVDGKNVALDAKGNIISINGPFFAGQTVIKNSQTEFDGSTPRLSVDVPLPNAATEHTLTIVICDAGDSAFDTAIMLAGLTTCKGADCGSSTTTSWCGDGKVDPQTEACDDGNNIDDDACTNACEKPGPAAVCGDGKVEGAEECDDGNVVDGDGCSKTCTKETALAAVCGDGKVEGAEECDDGNVVDGDGCSKTCTKETAPAAVCGDGKVEGAEECDDGNVVDGDGCSKTCTKETAPGDKDDDGVTDDKDNCPDAANADQADLDDNGVGDVCEANGEQLLLTGGPCSAAPVDRDGPWRLLGLLAMALLLMWRRRNHGGSRRVSRAVRTMTAAAILGGCCLGAAPAHAAYQLDAQLFKPSPFFHDGLSTGRGQTDGGYPWSMGLMLDYQKNPVVLRRTGKNAKVVKALVSQQLTANLMGSVRVFDWLAIGVAVPLVPLQGGNAVGTFAQPASFSLGDVRISPRARLVSASDDSYHVAVALDVTLPTGKILDHYTGRSTATFAPTVLADVRLGALTLVGNTALVLSGSDKVGNIELSQRIDVRVAAIYAVSPKHLEVIAEVQGATQLTAPFASAIQTPLEVRGAARYYLSESLVALAGAGVGMTKGAGNPDFRVFAGLQYAPHDAKPQPKPVAKPIAKPAPKPAPPKDSDGDGLLDPDDKCPNKAEDKDGFEDEDGCPDPDDDADKICDPWVADQGKSEQYKARCKGRDQCPRKPESYNSYQDEDGCPDQAVRIEKKKLIILQVVNFYLDETRIKEESLPLLNEVVQVLKDHLEISLIRVEGHTDLRGSRRHNMKLSHGRAKAVVTYLTDHGISIKRLKYHGYGPTRPLIKHAKNDQEHLANRRVEFNILKRRK